VTVPTQCDGMPLLEFLSGLLINESKTALRRHVGAGRVLLNGAPALTGAPLHTGDVVSLPAGLEPAPPPAAELPIRVLYEDAHHLCVAKPPGWPVLPGRKGEGAEFYHSLVALLNQDHGPDDIYVRPHVVHRLDRETSGVLLVARHVEAGRALSRQFQQRRVEKVYACIVEGVLPRPQVELDIPLERTPGSVLTMRPAQRGGKPARTLVRLRERFGHFSLLEVHPFTGRQHQIRVHLAAAGYPLAVDHLYGRRERMTGSDLNDILGHTVVPPQAVLLDRCPLHAESIRYLPPSSSEPRTQTCPLPADMADLLALLRREDPPSR